MSTSSSDKILQAAKKLFAEQGYAATSIRDIAALARVNSCLISYYFGNKEGVLHSIVDGVFENEMPIIFGILKSPIANFDEFQIRLEVFIESIITTGIKHWETVRIIRRETHQLCQNAEFNESSLASLKLLASFVEQAQTNDIIRNDFSAFMFADNLLAIIMNHISDWKMNQTTLNFDLSLDETRHRWIKEILSLLFHGIKSR